MSTEQLQQSSADVGVVLNAYTLDLVHRFRERYALYQACQEAADMQALAKQVDDLAFKVACSVDSALERVESEQVAKG